MSTRGNYIFHSRKKILVNIYNHWDNYPSGAAYLLNNMLLQDDEHNNRPAMFLKANPSAEVTQEIHGDSEYCYYIEGDKIRACNVGFDDFDKIKCTAFFVGSIYDFINKYLPEIYQISEGDTWKDRREKEEALKQNYWKNGKSLKYLEKELKAALWGNNDFGGWIHCCTFDKDNPNKNPEKITAILEQMSHFTDEN